jgi:phage-related tail protein
MQVDVNALEDELLLGGIASSERAALSRPATDFTRRAGHLGKLTASMPSVLVLEPSGAAKEQQQQQQQQQHSEAVKEAQTRLVRLQEEMTAVMRERSALSEQVWTQELHAGLVAVLSLCYGCYNCVAHIGEDTARGAGTEGAATYQHSVWQRGWDV